MLCNDVIKKLTVRVFDKPRKALEEQTQEGEKEGADPNTKTGEDCPEEEDVNMIDATQLLATQAPPQEDNDQNKDLGDVFELAQLLFVVVE